MNVNHEEKKNELTMLFRKDSALVNNLDPPPLAPRIYHFPANEDTRAPEIVVGGIHINLSRCAPVYKKSVRGHKPRESDYVPQPTLIPTVKISTQARIQSSAQRKAARAQSARAINPLQVAKKNPNAHGSYFGEPSVYADEVTRRFLTSSQNYSRPASVQHSSCQSRATTAFALNDDSVSNTTTKPLDAWVVNGRETVQRAVARQPFSPNELVRFFLSPTALRVRLSTRSVIIRGTPRPPAANAERKGACGGDRTFARSSRARPEYSLPRRPLARACQPRRPFAGTRTCWRTHRVG